MAWIKFDKDLLDDGRLLNWLVRLHGVRTVSATRPSKNELIGAIVRLWAHADTHISDDDTLDLTPDSLDVLVELPGFFESAPDSWVGTTDDGRVKLPGYCDKNRIESKRLRREKDADRKRAARASKPSARRPQNVRTVSANSPSGHRALDLDLDLDLDHKDKTPPTPSTRKPDFGAVPNLDPGAWAAWQAYRRAEKLRPYKSTQVAEALAKYPAPVQRATVQRSIEAGWQGLQPEKVANEISGRRGESRNFDDHTRRLAEWYLAATGEVLPGNA